MPLPSVEEWEWLNWKFPRPVHAGDTIYARWTLTQKRPPVGGAPTSIVVWRVDLHTADGALCAEGEVGAKVRRQLVVKEPRPQEPVAAGAAPRRRRGRRRSTVTANGLVPETPAIAAPAPPVAKPERAPGPARRRRRRRPSSGSGSSAPPGEPAGSPARSPEPAPAPAPAAPAPSAAAERGGLSGVIRRLRRT
jgi:hypothetical protein